MNLRSILLLALVPSVSLSAQVTLPKVFSSHMVIERNLPVHVWGMAAPGEEVSASFRGETRTTKAGPLGRWSLHLAPGEAGGPFALTVLRTA
jgi:sialate O-acetylesterase